MTTDRPRTVVIALLGGPQDGARIDVGPETEFPDEFNYIPVGQSRPAGAYRATGRTAGGGARVYEFVGRG